MPVASGATAAASGLGDDWAHVRVSCGGSGVNMGAGGAYGNGNGRCNGSGSGIGHGRHARPMEHDPNGLDAK